MSSSKKDAHPRNNRRSRKVRALATLGVVEKRPTSGHNVSHALNRTKRLFRPNLQKTKVLVDGKLVSVKLDAKTIRTLTKQRKERTPAKKSAVKKSATKGRTAAAAKTKKTAPKAAAKK
ncbi:MAG: 50S ribosomal protein L28 [Patescibacteria group bacterium]